MRLAGDVPFAIRNLTRSPGFTAIVVLTLALGIGASTAIFSVVNAVVLRPLAFPEPEQLVRVTSELRGFGATDTGVAPAELYDYQTRTDLFAHVAGILPVSANVTSDGTPERVEMLLVSWNYFAVLRVPPLHGRVFDAGDDTPGVANIAVVSHRFWQRRLSADPRAIGRTVAIDDDPVLVIGVMPPGFRHPGRTTQGDVDVWSPAGFRGPGAASPIRSRRRLEGCLARLQPGVMPEFAEARLAEYGVAASQQFPADYPSAHGWRPRVVPLQDDLVGGVAPAMFVLLGGVGLLLLVACVNVAHLVLARSSSRRQEMAVRRALGASRGRLTAQLAVESAVLAVAGGALGVLVASWVLRGLTILAPGGLPRIDDVRLDVTAVTIAGLIAVAVTLLFALVPAMPVRASELLVSLKEGGRGRSADRRGGRARNFLVAAEVALATVLLVAAGLFIRTVSGLLAVPVGFDTERLLTARITLPRPNDAARATYLDPARRVRFYRETVRRVSAIQGVERATMSSQIPLGGFTPPLFVEIDGATGADPGVRPVVHHFQVSPAYFETMGIPVLRGRPFAESDRSGSEPVAVASETAARLLWPGRDAIGQRLRFSPDQPWITVVGIAGDVLNRRLTEPPQPILYRSLDQSSDLSFALLIRARADVPGLVERVSQEVQAVDPDLPLHSVRTMSDVIAANVSQRRFLMRLLVLFGAVATALALLGVYGVMSYSVSQRTREIGIRMAVGARQADIARMILEGGLSLTVAGVVPGIAASAMLTRIAESQLFGVRPSDPVTLGAVLALMTAVAAGAAYLPARRAARVNPVEALRSE